MSSINAISIEKLVRLVGTPKCPALIDVRDDEDFVADPRLLPGAARRPFADAAPRTETSPGRSAVVISTGGESLSEGVAAWLRHAGRPRRRPGRRSCGLGRGGPATGPGGEAAAPQRAGAHRLGHPRAAQNGPHRLSLADPSLRRSRGVFLFVAAEEVGRSPNGSRRAFRHRGRRRLWSIAASSAPSTS